MNKKQILEKAFTGVFNQGQAAFNGSSTNFIITSGNKVLKDPVGHILEDEDVLKLKGNLEPLPSKVAPAVVDFTKYTDDVKFLDQLVNLHDDLAFMAFNKAEFLEGFANEVYTLARDMKMNTRFIKNAVIDYNLHAADNKKKQLKVSFKL
jgi:hypothetical protein